jgi:type IV pilus assembly protein PilA
MKQAPPNRGFSLIELMIVIAILGVIASVAIPNFLKFMMRAKTTEATMSVRKLFDGSVAYYLTDRYGPTGAPIPNQFPGSVGPMPNPATLGPQKVVTGIELWDAQPSWLALNFAIEDAHYFAYQYRSDGQNNASTFTAYAFGNLDGDTEFSTFGRLAHVVDASVVGSPGMLINRELD